MLEMPEIPTLVECPYITSDLGVLGVIEGTDILPFPVSRMYFIHNVPPGAERGSHAHKELKQLMMCLSGCVEVVLDDGDNTFTFVLKNSYQAIQVPSGYWRTLKNFSVDAVLVVLASNEYEESDYIRDRSEFLDWRANK
jgi:dTDP-4-dehydrorhamnose 3,5-epimerase-like enzyme